MAGAGAAAAGFAEAEAAGFDRAGFDDDGAAGAEVVDALDVVDLTELGAVVRVGAVVDEVLVVGLLAAGGRAISHSSASSVLPVGTPRTTFTVACSARMASSRLNSMLVRILISRSEGMYAAVAGDGEGVAAGRAPAAGGGVGVCVGTAREAFAATMNRADQQADSAAQNVSTQSHANTERLNADGNLCVLLLAKQLCLHLRFAALHILHDDREASL